jgi:hypothetical protein
MGFKRSLVTTPKERAEKRKKKRSCLSRRRVLRFPFFGALFWAPRRGVGARVAFFAYFFGETKK